MAPLIVLVLGLSLPNPPRTSTVVGRRAALATPLAFAALSVAPRPAEAAVPACPKGANNCLSTAGPTNVGKLTPWKFPAGMSKSAAVSSLRSVLQAYPQEGQAGVDLGGWSFVDDQLTSSGYARLEFKSGLGNFARFFNGGKPLHAALSRAMQLALYRPPNPPTLPSHLPCRKHTPTLLPAFPLPSRFQVSRSSTTSRCLSATVLSKCAPPPASEIAISASTPNGCALLYLSSNKLTQVQEQAMSRNRHYYRNRYWPGIVIVQE
jgi:hypothetical protein